MSHAIAGRIVTRTVSALALSLWAATTSRFAGSQPIPWITLTEPREHALPSSRLDGDTEIRTPIVFADAGRPTRLTVTSVRLVERSEEQSRQAFEFRVAGDDLVAKIRLDSVAKAGTYQVTVLARNDSAKREQRLELKYVRGAVLPILPWPTIRVETSSGPGAGIRPATWPISAPEGSAIAFPRQVVTAHLQGPDRKPLDARLSMTLPAMLHPGTAGVAELRLVGDLPRGTSVGSVLINSPQLREPLPVPVEIVSRASGLTLFGLLVFGITVGWLLRWWLTNRQEQVKAEAEAHEEYGRLRELATKEADRSLQTRLLESLAPLERALEERQSAARLRPTVVSISAAFTEALKKADVTRTELANKLKNLMERLGFPNDYPTPLNQLVHEVHDTAARAKRDLGSGLITDVEDALASLGTRVDTEVRDAARTWLDALTEFDRCGAWPDTRFEPLRLATLDVSESSATVTSNSLELLAFVRKGNSILDQIRGKGARSLKALADDAIRILKSVASVRPKDISAVRTAADSMAWSESDDSAQSIVSVVAAVSHLREALGEMISNAIPKGHERLREVENAIRDGQFKEAASIVAEVNKASLPAETTTPPLFRGRTPLGVSDPTDSAAASPERVHAWRIWIVSPARLVAGEPVLLSIGSSRPVPAQATFVWRVPGQAAVQTSGSSPVCQIVPRADGPLHIGVDGFDPTTDERATTMEVVSVRPAIGYAASRARRKESGVLEAVGQVASGVVIAFAGVLIFRETFVGDLAGKFSVFLWGFTTDIGLAKVAELAKPLASLQLPARPK